MKFNLLFLLLIVTQSLFAQAFTEINPFTPFAGVAVSRIAFADVDGDNDQDVLIIGSVGFNDISKLYINDGSGKFAERIGTPFESVFAGSIAFADVDGDNDQDVLITGENSSGIYISKLYTNNGLGSFTEMTGTPFEAVFGGFIAFEDVDGDNDQDVLITGRDSTLAFISKMYTNDGSGNFTEMMGTPFVGVFASSIAFADVDGDNDKDVLITGQINAFTPISKLYTNNGSGTFTEMTGTPFEGVNFGSIAFEDVDGDNDQDVLITGKDSSLVHISKLYTNNGSGTFTEMMGTPFIGVELSSIAFADVDGDNDQDVLITGENISSVPISKLYTNNGSGTFTERMGTPFEAIDFGSIAFADVDGDNDQDVLITGRIGSGARISKLFTNDGSGNFAEVKSIIESVKFSSIAFADVDGDNDQDVLITGQNASGTPSSKLYNNDGLGNYSERMGTPFVGVMGGSIAFADVDNDNDQDVLIVGRISSGAYISRLYINNGSGSFAQRVGTPFVGVYNSSIAFADVDGDNDQDVLITGQASIFTYISKLYINNGSGGFTERVGTPFESVDLSSIAFADVDGDNDQDVLITGRNISDNPISKLYTNNGSGRFTEMLGTPFLGVFSSSIDFADVDGDNDQDVLITGRNSSSVRISKLYTNNGSGSFTEMMGTPFVDVISGSIAFADVDGDNDQDVLITGENSSLARISKLYTNNGSGSFTEMMGTPFEGLLSSSIAFADVDGDNDQDVFITGQNISGAPVSKLFRNNLVLSSLDNSIIEINHELRLYPNPSTVDWLYINYFEENHGEVFVRIFSINGVQLRQQKEFVSSGPQTLSIDISSLPKGAYYLELYDSKRKRSGKFIVQ